MMNREIIEKKINFKDSKLTKEQETRLYDLRDKHYDAFSL